MCTIAAAEHSAHNSADFETVHATNRAAKLPSIATTVVKTFPYSDYAAIYSSFCHSLKPTDRAPLDAAESTSEFAAIRATSRCAICTANRSANWTTQYTSCCEADGVSFPTAFERTKFATSVGTDYSAERAAFDGAIAATLNSTKPSSDYAAVAETKHATKCETKHTANHAAEQSAERPAKHAASRAAEHATELPTKQSA